MTSDSTPDTHENPDPDADPLVGRTLADRYSIEGVLGRGGMGTVYLGRQTGLDRKVAIKVILQELAHSEKIVERFRREAAVTARLRHPNIVTVHDFGTLADGRMYLVMEFLAGPSLEQWIERKGVASPAETLAILGPVCRALSALHRADVIHRDLKPSNIVMPDPNDPDDMVKVVDFGIARLRESAGPKLTGNMIMGTPEFLAPEIIDGAEADSRSDIYALGIIAFLLLTGKLPFSGSSGGAILMQHLMKKPAIPSTINSEIGSALDEVVLRTLVKDPDRRYQSPEEFARALEAAVTHAAPAAEAIAHDAPTTVLGASFATRPIERSALGSILLIDDDEDLRLVNQTALEGAGYSVATASDGIEALLRLGGGLFDLIISDVDMPNLDGFALKHQMSQKGIDTPVIFVTGRSSDEDEIRGLELGAQDFLRKPVRPDVLLIRVRRHIRKDGEGLNG